MKNRLLFDSDIADDDRPVDDFDVEHTKECYECGDCSTCRTPCDYLMAVVEDEDESSGEGCDG